MSNERTNLINTLRKLEALETELGIALREYFNSMDQGGAFFSVEIDGRVHGDLTVKYKLGTDEYASNTVTGVYVDELPDEVAHRLGFSKRHDTKLLPKAADVPKSDTDEDTDEEEIRALY